MSDNLLRIESHSASEGLILYNDILQTIDHSEYTIDNVIDINVKYNTVLNHQIERNIITMEVV